MLRHVDKSELPALIEQFWPLTQDFTRSTYPTYADGIKTQADFASALTQALAREGKEVLVYLHQGRITGLAVIDVVDDTEAMLQICLWTDHASEMLAELLSHMRATASGHRLTVGFPPENTTLESFLNANGFEKLDESSCWKRDLSTWQAQDGLPQVELVTESSFAQFRASWQEEDMYWTADRIHAAWDRWRLFLCRDECGVRGVTACMVGEQMDQVGGGMVEPCGVMYDARGYDPLTFQALMTACLRLCQQRKNRHLVYFASEEEKQTMVCMGFELVSGYRCYALPLTANLLDGKNLAAQVNRETAERISTLVSRGIRPGLAMILVGTDPASQIYARNKEKACREVGVASVTLRLPENVTQVELEAQIRALNADETIHGILLQLPLPPHLHEATALSAIAPQKDVDGFHPLNAGCLLGGVSGPLPCTPQGVMTMLRAAGIPLAGKHAVVLGRSGIVGKPMALLLLQADCTVTICHSHTVNLEQLTRQADIIVSAVGQPGFVKAEMVKPGAVVVDVGINRVNGRVVGDVDFAGVRRVAGYLSPVPGGVGCMTIAMLMKNTVDAAERQTNG